MKKVIIALCAGLATSVLSAATFAWNVDGIPASSGSGLGENYLVSFIETATVPYDTALAQLQSGSTAVAASATWSGLTDEDGYVSQKKLGSYSAGDSVTGYLVILDAAAAGSAENYMILPAQTATVPANGANISMSFTSAVSGASWNSLSGTPAPEPTSGLLVLLGVAGLALRRRRA